MTQEIIHKHVINRGRSVRKNEQHKSPFRERNQLRMVENTIRNSQIFSSDTQLRKSLPRRISYPSLKVVLEHLERNNKIMRNKDGSIVWIYADSPQSRKSLEESILLR